MKDLRSSLKLALCLWPAFIQAQELAFITNQNSSDLSIVDLQAREEILRIDVPGGAAGVAVSSMRVYTISPDDATLREYAHSGELCREVLLKGGPIAVAVDETRNRAFVSDWYNAAVYVVDLVSFEQIATMPTASAPSGLAVSPAHNIVATADRDADQVSIFSAGTLTPIGAVKVGERPFGITISDGGFIFVTNVGSNSVSVIDLSILKVVAEIPTGERPYSVSLAKEKGFVTDQYADQLTVFDEESFAPESTIEVGEYPEGIDHNVSQTELYVANWFSNTISVIDTNTSEVVDEIAVGDGPRAFGRFVVPKSDANCTGTL